MTRPTAGHGSTRTRNGVHLIANDAGDWITTGHARHWLRCSRCRRPTEAFPFESTACPTCYFYGMGMSGKEFWRLHDEGYYLAPYNIGARHREKATNGE